MIENYHYMMWKICIRIGKILKAVGGRSLDAGWRISDRGAMNHWMLTKKGKRMVEESGNGGYRKCV